MKHMYCVMLLFISLLICTVPVIAEEVQLPELTNLKSFSPPESAALSFVRNLGAGWNLGNTFDAYNDSLIGNELTLERYWCGVKTTREMIAAVRAAGFRSIRIPTSWHNHVDADFHISEAWMDRVQEVVDWCMEEGFYVILHYICRSKSLDDALGAVAALLDDPFGCRVTL